MGCTTSKTCYVIEGRFPVAITEHGMINLSGLEFVANSKLPNRQYVLSPLYSHGDCQPGIVTGTVRVDETYIAAAHRELREELCLKAGLGDLVLIDTVVKGTRTWKIYALAANNAFVTNIPAMPLGLPKEEDNKNQKVAVIVHGTFRECAKLVEQTQGTKRGETDIISTRITSVKMLRKLKNR